MRAWISAGVNSCRRVEQTEERGHRTTPASRRGVAMALMLAAIATPVISAASGTLTLQPTPSASSLSPQERDLLYREFLTWRAKRGKAGNASK